MVNPFSIYRRARETQTWTSPATGAPFRFHRVRITDFMRRNKGDIPKPVYSAMLRSMAGRSEAEMDVEAMGEMIEANQMADLVIIDCVVHPVMVATEEEWVDEDTLWVGALGDRESGELFNAIIGYDEALAAFRDEESGDVDAVPDSESVESEAV